MAVAAPRGLHLRHLFILVFVVYCAFLLVSHGIRFYQIRREAASVMTELARVRQENLALQERLHTAGSDAFVSQAAREELGLSRPGEITYLLPDGASH